MGAESPASTGQSAPPPRGREPAPTGGPVRAGPRDEVVSFPPVPRSARSRAGAAAAAGRLSAGGLSPCAAIAVVAAVAVLAAAGASGPALAGTVEGQAFDREGRPLAGVTVALLERSGGGLLSRSPAQEQVLLRVRTDAQGFFAFDTGPREVRGKVVVRCADGPGWDALRYAAPGEVEVTRGLRDRGRAVVSCVAEDAPGWRALAQEIERVGGPGSDRGQVLRRHGLPPETVTAADGSVEWRYPGGAVFAFRDGALVRAPEAPGESGAAEADAGDPR